MTREEVISKADVKNAMYKVCLHEENKDIFVKLLDEINKLQPVNAQVSCEKAISRQATIEAFQMFRGYEANRTNAEWVDRIETVVKKLPPVNPQEPLTEEDYIELHDRFGDYVEFVVKDMISGKGERWTKNNPQKPKYCDRNICVSNEYNGIGCDECEVTKSQEPKTGHWISFGVQGEVGGQIVRVFTCSECGAISIFRMASGNIVNGDICPNCGAKMVEPQESENP